MRVEENGGIQVCRQWLSKRLFKLLISKYNCLIILSNNSAFNKEHYEFKRVYFNSPKFTSQQTFLNSRNIFSIKPGPSLILVVPQPGCTSELPGELVKSQFRTYLLILNFQGCYLELAFLQKLPTISWSPMTLGDFRPTYASIRIALKNV